MVLITKKPVGSFLENILNRRMDAELGGGQDVVHESEEYTENVF